MLRGIHQYIAEHGPWSVFMELRSLESRPPSWLAGWRGDGIITRTVSQSVANAIEATGVPAVELRATRLRHRFPFVGVGNRAIGRLIAEHLLERGFRQFGLYALNTESYFVERNENFIATLRAAGFPCQVFQAGSREQPAQWERQQDALVRWVAGLDKPVGIMACTDQLGFWLLDACQRASVSVPEQAAVVGVENDESLCSMATPPLSSMAFDAVRNGYTAAQALHRLMRGQRVPRTQLIPPLGVRVRASSDIVAMDDAELAAALRWIREHACQGLGVPELLRAVPVSRSRLERGLRAALGRSPHDEVLRIRLDHARRLLIETELSLVEISRRSGFSRASYFNEAFKRQFQTPPGGYRAAARRDKISE
ncbi:MAG: substrate-binding domain-containing protein [Planctomycetes bacterium]|nr:substrate-binding domain-containing protein [Planctomycetota bacterium]